jgi:hypothetical protein
LSPGDFGFAHEEGLDFDFAWRFFAVGGKDEFAAGDGEHFDFDEGAFDFFGEGGGFGVVGENGGAKYEQNEDLKFENFKF